MSRSITITVTNIPEKEFLETHADCAREAKKDFGLSMPVKEHITIDFELLIETYPDLFPEILGAAFTCQVIQQADEFFNKPTAQA